MDLHGKLAAAVKRGKRDRRGVRGILKGQVEPLRREVDRPWKIHREMWLGTYRPFGWEVLEGRNGGLHHRLETLADRLRDYVAGRVDSIPELETRLLKIIPKDDIYTMIRRLERAEVSASVHH